MITPVPYRDAKLHAIDASLNPLSNGEIFEIAQPHCQRLDPILVSIDLQHPWLRGGPHQEPKRAPHL